MSLFLFVHVHRYLHWSYRSNSGTQLYSFQINPKISATPLPLHVPELNFSFESFTEDVVNDCLVLANDEGSLQYFTNGQLHNECPNRTPIIFGKNNNS